MPLARRPVVRALTVALLFAAFSVLMPEPRLVWAQESTLEDEPVPDSVEEYGGPLVQAFRRRLRAETLFPRIKDRLEDLPPFFRDTELTLRPRSFYMNRRRADHTRAKASALGGSLEYRSGWLADTFSVGAELYTSQKLSGAGDEDGTSLLEPGQEGYTVLGRLYGALRYGEHELTLYRQELGLPYINKNDSRMTPNTFEAYTLRGGFGGTDEPGRVDYLVGHVTRMKKRNEESFISMSEAAGVSGNSGRGLTMAGAMITPCSGCRLGAVDYYVEDTINIAYGAADYTHLVSDDLGLRFQGQFTHQTSVGDDLLTGKNFDTWVMGGRAAASFKSFILTLAFSSTDDEAAIRSPFGSYAGYLSLMQKDFNRAGEDAWLIGTSYVFDRLGLEGLSAYANYAEGSDARDAESGASLPGQKEADLTVDYRVGEGRWRGFWLRIRGSLLDVDGERNMSKEVRVIINYDIPAL